MPTFLRFASKLLILGLIVAAVAYFVRSNTDSVDPPQAEQTADPDALANELESGDIDEEFIEDEEPMTEDAETLYEEGVQSPDLDEGEVMESDELEPAEEDEGVLE